jgi:gluconokinase
MPQCSTRPAKPVVLIVMGVSGCGKSTLASQLADNFGCEYVEADDYHTEHAKSLMASGTPLSDDHREPWIQSLCDTLTSLTASGKSAVMAYSGLRAAHRERFRCLGFPIQFIHLIGEKDNHFMPADLVDSQFAALEPTRGESDVAEISVDITVAEIIEKAKSVSQRFMAAH